MAEGGTGHARSLNKKISPPCMFKHEDESRETSFILSLIGYGPDLRNKRIDYFKAWDKGWTARDNCEIMQMTVGSKSEGLTSCLENDIDILYVRANVVCLEDSIYKSSIPVDITIFKMDTRNCYAGYCRLIAKRLSSVCSLVYIYPLCVDENGDFLLNSEMFIDSYKSLNQTTRRAGPSLPFSAGPFKFDTVEAIRCVCPSIIQKWAQRSRQWPPANIVQKVVSMDACVVPVGFKGSEYKHLEWRICFTTAETELMNNLNDTQAKILVLLKMILKDVLNPRKKELTSYTMKNITLWQAENNNQTLFHERSLLYWLYKGLEALRTAISKRELPNYMIPERNLMAACGLDDEMQSAWVATITDMLHEGPRLILRLKKIRQAINAYPEPLLWYSRRKTEIEMLELECMNRLLRLRTHNMDMFMSDGIHRALRLRQLEILKSVMKQAKTKDIINRDTVLSLLERILS